MIGEVLPSNSAGSFEILQIVGKDRLKVRFIDTGYETIGYKCNIMKGQVKDLLSPSVFDVGYLGGTFYKTSNFKGGHNPTYEAWRRMLKRCYSTDYRCYGAYGGRGGKGTQRLAQLSKLRKMVLHTRLLGGRV